MYLGFWRLAPRKPAPLQGVGEKCASEVSKSGLRLFLTRYESVAGRTLYDVAGLMEAEDYDADLAAARLLGRDVAAILTRGTREVLLPILDQELAAGSSSLLIGQLSRGGRSGGAPGDADFQKMRSLLTSFRAGLTE